MQKINQILATAVTLVTTLSAADAAVIHAGAPLSVPVDSPLALGALATLITIVVARVISKRKD